MANDQLTSAISHPVGNFNYPFTQLIDYNGTTYATYIGYALPGTLTSNAGWAIQYLQYDVNNNVTSVTWATNYLTFGDIWTARAGLSYS